MLLLLGQTSSCPKQRLHHVPCNIRENTLQLFQCLGPFLIIQTVWPSQAFVPLRLKSILKNSCYILTEAIKSVLVSQADVLKITPLMFCRTFRASKPVPEFSEACVLLHAVSHLHHLVCKSLDLILKNRKNITYFYIDGDLIFFLNFFLKAFIWGTESWHISSESNFSLLCFNSWIPSQRNAVFAVPIFPGFVLQRIYLLQCRIYTDLQAGGFYLLPSPARRLPAKITAYTTLLHPFCLCTFWNKYERKKKKTSR